MASTAEITAGATAAVAAPTAEAKRQAAESLREVISQRGNRIRVPSLPATHWQDLLANVTSFTALANDPQSTVERRTSNRNRCAQSVNDLRVQLDAFRTSLREMKLENEVISIDQLVEEMTAVEAEFGGLRVAPAARKIVARSQPIILEEDGRNVDLGQFDLTLEWGGNTPDGIIIRPIAVTPNAADGSNGSVTHPHVRDNKLCPGEGLVATQAAYNAGRIYDAFIIVRQTLETYNAGGAHMRLNRWTIQRICRICSDLVQDANEFATCTACRGDRRCTKCMVTCGREGCNTVVCASCIFTCPACRTAVCRSCQQRCANCNIALCRGCFPTRQCANARTNDGHHVAA